MYTRLLFFLLFASHAVSSNAQVVVTLRSQPSPTLLFYKDSDSVLSPNAPNSSTYAIIPSDSLQQRTHQFSWYLIHFRNETPVTKWRLSSSTGHADPGLWIVDPYGQPATWPIGIQHDSTDSSRARHYFELDFSGLPELSVQVYLDRTADTVEQWHMEPVKKPPIDSYYFVLFSACLITIIFSLLIFLFFARDIVYAVAVPYFLCQGFWFIIQAISRPIYTIPPMVMQLFELVSMPIYFLFFPVLFYQSLRSSITVKLWIIHGALVTWFFFAADHNYSFPDWLLQYVTFHLYITAALMIAGIAEQFVRDRKRNVYYTACLILALLELSVTFVNVSYVVVFMLELLIYAILVYRFIVTLKQRKKHLIDAAREQGKVLASSIINIQEDERARIGRDLHDEVGASLAALKHYAASIDSAQLPEMKNIIEQLDQCARSVRYISHNLLPPMFATTPIDQLLGDHLHFINEKSTLRFQFISTGDMVDIPIDVKLSVYRIVLELVTNTIRHSAATEASVQLICRDELLQIICEDNGRGFSPGRTAGLGLKNIRSRVEYLDGQMHIDSGAGGTAIIIELPVKPATAQL